MSPTDARPAPQTWAAPAGRRHAVFHRLRVSDVERLTDDAVAVTFDVPAQLREEFRFLPGQHVTVRSPGLGDDVRRNYSICAPATRGPLRIGVKRIRGGLFSTYATERLRPGDLLDVMTPTGTFTTVPHPARVQRYAAVAAGSGITPVLSILSTALQVEPASSAVLVYVNRSPSRIMFLEDVQDLKNRHPQRFELVHVLGEESPDVELLSGRLDADRLERILDTLVPPDDVDEWFLCGPLAMTDAVRAVLLARGANPEQVHREVFHVEAPPVHSGNGIAAPDPRQPAASSDPHDAPGNSPPRQPVGASVTVLLDGRAQTFVLTDEAMSILDATLRVRPDAPFACKNAVCGTCRAKVVDGQVRMASNYALQPHEVAAGFVLTCQAHPLTDRVTVDFDR